MDKAPRPLWQLLLLTNESEGFVQFTCEECFTLLEYDADLLAVGADLDEIQSSVSRHLNLCTKCQTKFDDWLEYAKKRLDLQPDQN